MFPDHWGSDYDYAEAHGNGKRERPSEPTGRVLSPAEMSAELRRIFAKVLERIERERQTGAKA